MGVCPVDALTVGDELFPELDAERCVACGRCGRCCPGGAVDFAGLTRLMAGKEAVDADDFDGVVLESTLAHAADDALRSGGASGGAVTALLADMLRSGVVDGCVVAQMAAARPCEGEVFIARTVDELAASQQSLYLCIPVNSILRTIRGCEGSYAIVALPCQVHGLRMAMAEDSVLAERIVCIIGLFCATTIEPCFPEEILAARGIKREEICGFRFREGEWPGRICAMLPGGSARPLHPSNFKDGAINYMAYLYSPPRCQMCIDGSAEFADISAADAWARDDSGGYKNRGETRLLIRSDAGMRSFRAACDSGALVALEGSSAGARRTPKHHRRKKAVTHRLRIARRKRAGRDVPQYDRAVPGAGAGDRLLERMESFLMWIGRKPPLRRVVFSFLTSPAGAPLIWLRRLRKRRGYRSDDVAAEGDTK